jgi:hypothetical protein
MISKLKAITALVLTVSALVLGGEAVQAAPAAQGADAGPEIAAPYYSCQKGYWDGYKWCYTQSYATYCYEEAMTWMDNQTRAGQKARVIAVN